MGHSASLYTAHDTPVWWYTFHTFPFQNENPYLISEAFLQTLFSRVDHLPMSPHDHHCCLGGKSWNRVPPIISSLKFDRWVSTFYIFLPSLSLPNKVTGHSVIGSKILTRPKTTTIWTFLKPVCEQRAKNKRRRRVTVNDFYLLLTTKVIFFFSFLFFQREFCLLFFVRMMNWQKSDSVWSYFTCHRLRGCRLGGLKAFA